MADRTLLLLYPGCIEYEVGLAVELVGRAMPVEVATPSGDDHVSQTGLRIAADTSIADAAPARYRLVLTPGGDPGCLAGDEACSALLRRAAKAGAWLAAICAGPFLLAQAGLLDGRRATHGFPIPLPGEVAPAFAGSTWSSEGVAVDGRIVTAQASAHVAFGVEVAVRVGAVAEENAEQLRRWYLDRAR